MPLAREKDLHEVRRYRQLDQRATGLCRMHRNGFVRSIRSFAAFNEILVENALRDLLRRKMLKREPHIAARVPLLQAPRQQHIERSTGDNAQLACGRNRTRQAPARNSSAHTALNDDRKTFHTLQLLQPAEGRLSEFCITHGR